MAIAIRHAMEGYSARHDLRHRADLVTAEV